METPQIIREKLHPSTLIKCFGMQITGLGAARNMGIQKATSEIVAMIDSDVTLDKGWYSQLIGHFQNPDVAAVMGTCVYGYGCKPLESYWEYQRCNETINYGCQNTMFKRELVLKVGNFNKAIKGAGEDYDLFQRLLSAGFEWLWIRDASAYHPMTIMEYIKHVRWWARGQPYIIEAANWTAKTSLIRVYARQVFYMIESFFKGSKAFGRSASNISSLLAFVKGSQWAGAFKWIEKTGFAFIMRTLNCFIIKRVLELVHKSLRNICSSRPK